MAQYAITYAPNLSGGEPANTSKTGSFRIGNLTQGKVWNQAVPQTTTNTLFFASPPANNNNAQPYIIALPNPAKPAPFTGLDQPQFFYSQIGGDFSQTDGAFISTCDYILKGYTAAGAVASPGSGVNPAGCSDVTGCKAAINAAGFFQSYGFTAP